MVFPAFVEKIRAGAVRPAGHMGPDVARAVRQLHFNEPFERLPKKQANIVVAANANQGGEVKFSLKPAKGKSSVKKRGTQDALFDWWQKARADRAARKARGTPKKANVVVAANVNQGGEVKVSLKPVKRKSSAKKRSTRDALFDWWQKARADRAARKGRANVVVSANQGNEVNVKVKPLKPVKRKSSAKKRGTQDALFDWWQKARADRAARKGRANVLVSANQGSEVNVKVKPLKPVKRKSSAKKRGTQDALFDWWQKARADRAARRGRGSPKKATPVVVVQSPSSIRSSRSRRAPIWISNFDFDKRITTHRLKE